VIYAVNRDAAQYRGIHPNLDRALDHITPAFLNSLKDNVRVELDGMRVYCTRFTYETIPLEENFFEAHRRYLDIHIMLDGQEGVDVAHPEELTLREAKEENDFYAYDGAARFSTVLKPGEFLVVFPGDAHRIKMQLGEPQKVSKAVFKILLED
jgi:biofilm protein TabA